MQQERRGARSSTAYTAKKINTSDIDPFHAGPEGKLKSLRLRILDDIDEVFQEFSERVKSALLESITGEIGQELTTQMYESLHEKITTRDWTLADIPLGCDVEEWRRIKEWWRFLSTYALHEPIRVYPNQVPRSEWRTWIELCKKENLILF
ncbi:hypothetical protein QAD02_012932 [Eretmocerus hayati]|uniref:Uncharacterized protein n=1 Tax=Eretmocerus hayati TaxID=131215 RepID=A0ACC2P5V4_9HYME|nr:hypothetical protein QAD02_012932 [Eretmocerus hayati]